MEDQSLKKKRKPLQWGIQLFFWTKWKVTYFQWQFWCFAFSCGFHGGNEKLWEIVASSPFFSHPLHTHLLLRDFSWLVDLFIRLLKLSHVSETALKANALRVFAKIQKWIIDPLMIHNRGGFFGSYLKPDTLETWSKAFLYYKYKKVNTASGYSKQIQFNTYISCLTTLLVFTAIF